MTSDLPPARHTPAAFRLSVLPRLSGMLGSAPASHAVVLVTLTPIRTVDMLPSMLARRPTPAEGARGLHLEIRPQVASMGSKQNAGS